MSDDLYDILGVNKKSELKEIKSAWRKKALKCHPDRGGDGEMFKKIQHAYEVLSDSHKRDQYDNTKSFCTKRGLFNGVFKLFKMFTNRSKVPEPSIITKYISLEQLCRNTTVDVCYTRKIKCDCVTILKCDQCGGSGSRKNIIMIGYIRSETSLCCIPCKGSGKLYTFSCGDCDNGYIKKKGSVQLELKSDMKNGHRSIIKKKGDECYTNGTVGDLYIVIDYLTHPIFKVSNVYDLTLTLDVQLKNALVCFKKTILHPNGEYIYINTKGVVLNSSSKIISKGKGINNNGSLIIRVNIIFPKTLTDDQKKGILTIL